MKKQTNLAQIAEAAGVSVSTVDRVMNGRGSVSLARRRRVIEAARSVGAMRVPAATSGFSFHFNVVRTAADDEYFSRLERALAAAAAVTSPPVKLHFLRETPKTSGDWAAVMQASAKRRHGVILLTHDLHDERNALNRIGSPVVPVVAMSSDIEHVAQRFYVGIDNLSAGATAALLIAGLAPRSGRVLVLTGPQSFRVHRDRSDAFIDALMRHAPGLKIIGPLDMGDRVDEAHRLTRGALQGDIPLVGVYNTGGANVGVANAIATIRGGQHPIWVAHETTPGNVSLMRDGLVKIILDQDPDAQAVTAIQYLLYANGEIGTQPVQNIRFHIVTPENLPPD